MSECDDIVLLNAKILQQKQIIERLAKHIDLLRMLGAQLETDSAELVTENQRLKQTLSSYNILLASYIGKRKRGGKYRHG